MKQLFLIAFLSTPFLGFSQNFISLATDPQGDAFHIDAKEISYLSNPSEDTLFIKIAHYNPRTANYGFALALDTNLNPADGFSIDQSNMFNQASNLSLNYDLALYAYEFSNYPGMVREAYDANGMITQVPFGFDTSNALFSIFSIPLSSIGGNVDLNFVAFTGTFTINPGGSGPSDAMPNNTFVSLREASINLEEINSGLVNAYPNPASTFLNIQSNEEAQTMLLLDFKGRIVKEFFLEKSLKINISELPKGLYFLKPKKEQGRALKIAIR